MPKIRTQAVKLLGEIVRQHGPVVNDTGVLKRLGDDSLRVRYVRRRHAWPSSATARPSPPLLQLAANNHPLDPYIRLASVLGMVGCNIPPSSSPPPATHPCRRAWQQSSRCGG